MNDHRAWVQWWAWPWMSSVSDWNFPSASTPLPALARSHHQLMNTMMAIEPCLPIFPSPALLQLVLAPADQKDLMLTFIDSICRPSTDSPLSEDRQLWCQRLSKVLPPDLLLVPTEDPLQSLRAWVEPVVWQRLRLSFSRQRVLEMEKFPRRPSANARLHTLWQAVVWRVTSKAGATADAYPPGEADEHVM